MLDLFHPPYPYPAVRKTRTQSRVMVSSLLTAIPIRFCSYVCASCRKERRKLFDKFFFSNHKKQNLTNKTTTTTKAKKVGGSLSENKNFAATSNPSNFFAVTKVCSGAKYPWLCSGRSYLET